MEGWKELQGAQIHMITKTALISFHTFGFRLFASVSINVAHCHSQKQQCFYFYLTELSVSGGFVGCSQLLK